MWRNYLICVLIGLLLAISGASLMLLRQNSIAQGQLDRFRQRAISAESTRTSLEDLLTSTPSSRADAASASQTPTLPIVSLGAPTPTPSVAAAETLEQIEADVAALRGLQPKVAVPVRFMDQGALQKLYVDRFNQDYLPAERESDQKLLSTLGVIGPNQSVVQLLLGILQEQILGLYSQEDKSMYLLAGDGQLSPDERSTIAQGFDHALQDQYFDLTTLAPKHPDNDDRSLAIQAVTEGDATLLQRLWAQRHLTQAELSELGQGSGGPSKLLAAPLFLREQLLFPYTDGFNFVRQIYQTSGYTGVDDVFRDPPQSTAQILHIDKYRRHVAPVDVNLPDLVADGSLGDGWRVISSNVMGELHLRLLLTQLIDSTSGVRGASGWAGDRWELLENGGRQALVIKSVWDDEASAKTFFDTFSQGMSNRLFGALVDESSTTRQALTAPTLATDVRRDGPTTVVSVISFDRATATAIADAAT